MQWNLIRLRKENNETQDDVAKILGVDEQTYRNKEKGKTQFKSDEMFVLAEHYGKNLNEIFLPIKYTNSKQNKKEGV